MKPLVPMQLLVLALATASAGTAFAANPGERPRPENYPNYSQYIQALFEYQRNQEKPPESSSEPTTAEMAKLCSEDSGQAISDSSKKLTPDEERKRNTCRENLLLSQTLVVPEEGKDKASKKVVPAYEDLDQAIARAQQSRQPGSADNGAMPRTTYNSFPLQEIPAQAMSLTSVNDLLGLFSSLGQLLPNTASRLSYNSSSSVNPDGSLRASADNYTISLNNVSLAYLTQIGGLIGFSGGGYTVFSTVTTVSNNALDILLRSNTHTGLYIVDRDGVSASPGVQQDPIYYNAGALTIDNLNITVPRLDINIQGVQTTNNNGILQVQATSLQPITVDLSATHIGVADAVRDGSVIGNSTNFLSFGPQSALTIAAGTRVTTLLSNTNGGTTPFVTFNGHVGDISLNDIHLLDNPTGGEIRIGNLAIHNIDLVNAKFFVADQKVTVDLGTGMTNLGIDAERVAIGNTVIGDFYGVSGHLNSLRFAVEPH